MRLAEEHWVSNGVIKSKKSGELSEWLKEHAWKVCIRQRIEGSNPSLSAIFKPRLFDSWGFFMFGCLLARRSHLFLQIVFKQLVPEVVITSSRLGRGTNPNVSNFTPFLMLTPLLGFVPFMPSGVHPQISSRFKRDHKSQSN